MDPKFIAPLVGYLSHETCTDNGELYETGGAWISRVRLQRSDGIQATGLTAETLREKFA